MAQKSDEVRKNINTPDKKKHISTFQKDEDTTIWQVLVDTCKNIGKKLLELG